MSNHTRLAGEVAEWSDAGEGSRRHRDARVMAGRFVAR
jgi:hypothetical protein